MDIVGGCLNSGLLEGGVYLFTLNGIPLYVGETQTILCRLAKHMETLYENPHYFGLYNRKEGNKLDFYILKKCSDSRKRLELERDYINILVPVLQRNSYTYDKDMIKRFKSYKCDSMVSDTTYNRALVDTAIVNERKYDDVKKYIKDEVESGNFKYVDLSFLCR